MHNQKKFLVKVEQRMPKKLLYSGYIWADNFDNAMKEGQAIRESLKDSHVYNGKWAVIVREFYNQ